MDTMENDFAFESEDELLSNVSTREIVYTDPETNLVLLIFRVVSIIFALTFTVFNGIVMVVILAKRKLRSSPKYFLVINLSIVGLIDGVLLSPIQTLVWSGWNLPCYVTAPAQTMILACNSVDLMLVISLCILWISSITIPSYTSKTRFNLALFLAGTSWLTIVSVALQYFGYPGGRRIYFDLKCVYVMEEWAQVIVAVTTPLPLLFTLTLTLILLFVVRYRQSRGGYNMEANQKEFPIDVFLVALGVLFCLICDLSFTLIATYSIQDSVIQIVLGRLRHLVIPLVWLTMSKPIRNILFCKGEESDTETHNLSAIEQK